MAKPRDGAEVHGEVHGPVVHNWLARRSPVHRLAGGPVASQSAYPLLSSRQFRRVNNESDEVMTMNETYVTVSGNVVGDPVARLTKADVPFVTFRVASNVRRVNFKTGEYVDAGTNFVNVTAFRALGINLANSLKKGEPVVVYGRMRINQWVNGEKSGTTVEIDAYNVGHDLTWGQAKFTKVAKPQFNQSDRMADPEVQAA